MGDTEMETREAAVVILAAGRSERMKEMKAFLLYEENNPFIKKIISTYSDWGCREIIVVTGREAAGGLGQLSRLPFNIKVVINDHLDYERFYSVKLGLREIITSRFCFIQNVDNPFIDENILDLIYKSRGPENYISPVFESKGGHPVLLNRQNMISICNWQDDSANFREVLNTMAGTEVEMPDDRVLININSPEDYKAFFKMAGAE
jgi:CTP:molybdopterin cytidylyltransferase MocA